MPAPASSMPSRSPPRKRTQRGRTPTHRPMASRRPARRPVDLVGMHIGRRHPAAYFQLGHHHRFDLLHDLNARVALLCHLAGVHFVVSLALRLCFDGRVERWSFGVGKIPTCTPTRRLFPRPVGTSRHRARFGNARRSSEPHVPPRPTVRLRQERD
ncbi:hypothetical protein EXIGLDRAFT_754159, partial [Exidia glandulosa HHB12029]